MYKYLLLMFLTLGMIVSPARAEDESFRSLLMQDANGRSSLAPESDTKLSGGAGFQFNYSGVLNNGGDYDGGFAIPFSRIYVKGSQGPFGAYLSGTFESDEAFDLEYAYGTLNWQSFDWQFGQLRLPFWIEQNVDQFNQLATDRSTVSYIFGQGITQGITASKSFDAFTLTGALSNGFEGSESDYALTGRADWQLLGDKPKVLEFTSAPDEASNLHWGLAGTYQNGDESDEVEMYSYTSDATYKWHGFTSTLAGVGRTSEDYTDWGVLAQAGYRVLADTELFGRYDVTIPDNDWGLDSNNYQFATIGVNYYLAGQAAKITADCVYALDGNEGLSTIANAGGIGLPSMDPDAVAFRLQFQLLF